MAALELSYRPIVGLIPFANNSRTHSDAQVAQIAASIREFGFTNPILIDEDGGIIAGHGRVLAARKLSMDTVPTIALTGLTKTQRKAYVIADNKLALNAGWDNELLALELAELVDLGFDLEITGFSQEEIDTLLPDLIPEGLTDEDAVPEVPETPVTVLGDVWLCGKHRVMCGDSTSIDAVEKLMDGQKADMVFTDPPYGISLVKGSNGKVGGGTKEYPTKEFSAIIGDDEPFDVQSLFGYCEDMIVWGGNYFADRLPAARCWFIWNKNHPVDRTFCGCEIAWTTLDRHSKIFDSTWDGWTKEGESGSKVHPSQKPIKLCADILSDTTALAARILDLFGGSGSTLIACEKTGRNARLMELDEKYVDVIVKRWQEFTGKQATLESTGENFPSIKGETP